MAAASTRRMVPTNGTVANAVEAGRASLLRYDGSRVDLNREVRIG